MRSRTCRDRKGRCDCDCRCRDRRRRSHRADAGGRAPAGRRRPGGARAAAGDQPDPEGQRPGRPDRADAGVPRPGGPVPGGGHVHRGGAAVPVRAAAAGLLPAGHEPAAHHGDTAAASSSWCWTSGCGTSAASVRRGHEVLALSRPGDGPPVTLDVRGPGRRLPGCARATWWAATARTAWYASRPASAFPGVTSSGHLPDRAGASCPRRTGPRMAATRIVPGRRPGAADADDPARRAAPTRSRRWPALDKTAAARHLHRLHQGG